MSTWNILHGRSTEDGAVDAGRLHAAAAELDSDVVGLQEVDRGQPRSGGRDLTAEVADALGARERRFVPTLIGTPGRRWRPAGEEDLDAVKAAYGVALATRYPVLRWHTLRMPVPAVRAPILVPGTRKVFWVADEPRVAIAAVLRAPGGTLTVATTHPSFVPGQNVLQLARLSRWLRRLPGPRVLLGDLNLPALVVGPVSGLSVLARARTYPARAARVQLDHVLGDGTARPRGARAHRLPVSDHLALSVDL